MSLYHNNPNFKRLHEKISLYHNNPEKSSTVKEFMHYILVIYCLENVHLIQQKICLIVIEVNTV